MLTKNTIPFPELGRTGWTSGKTDGLVGCVGRGTVAESRIAQL